MESLCLGAFKRYVDVALRDVVQQWDAVGEVDGWT